LKSGSNVLSLILTYNKHNGITAATYYIIYNTYFKSKGYIPELESGYWCCWE